VSHDVLDVTPPAAFVVIAEPPGLLEAGLPVGSGRLVGVAHQAAGGEAQERVIVGMSPEGD
jgi:hypothetical protein